MLAFAAICCAAVAAVLVFAVRSRRADRERLREDFAESQQAVVREIASDLGDRLDDIEEDARMLAKFVERTRHEVALDPQEDRRLVLSSLAALASVARHYRVIALYPPDGGEPMVAADGGQGEAAAEVLLALAQHSGALHARVGGAFVGEGDRSFFAYAWPLTDEGRLVIVVDAQRFLRAFLHPIPDRRVALIDPAGSYWLGCSRLANCELVRASDRGRHPVASRLARTIQETPTGTAWPPGTLSSAVGLPGTALIAAWQQLARGEDRPWTVIVLSSAAAFQNHERQLEQRLVLATVGLVGFVLVVAMLVARQQRRAAVLDERLRHAEEVRHLQSQLVRAEKLATTGVLAAGLAHEVGTPLGIIRARAELLLETANGSSLKQGLGAIIRQIDHIATTIRKVLDFSRAQPVHPRPVDVGQAFSSVVELLDVRLGKLGIEAHVDLPAAGLPALAADPDQLQQVLVNLILNAADASEPRKAVRLVARHTPKTGFVELQVEDEGRGIAPEDMNAVFDPFFSTKKRGEGTGLGLPIAASIVRNHGGEIALASEPGRGTTVTIQWPVASPTAAG
jgi:signal transduction histidine kinase